MTDKKVDESINYPPEMDDWKKVMEMGAKKHGANNWLTPDGAKSSHFDMHMSGLHHWYKSFTSNPKYREAEMIISPTTITVMVDGSPSVIIDRMGDHDWTPIDMESGLDHTLHLACRTLMIYTLNKLGITHVEDQVDEG